MGRAGSRSLNEQGKIYWMAAGRPAVLNLYLVFLERRVAVVIIFLFLTLLWFIDGMPGGGGERYFFNTFGGGNDTHRLTWFKLDDHNFISSKWKMSSDVGERERKNGSE